MGFSVAGKFAAPCGMEGRFGKGEGQEDGALVCGCEGPTPMLTARLSPAPGDTPRGLLAAERA